MAAPSAVQGTAALQALGVPLPPTARAEGRHTLRLGGDDAPIQVTSEEFSVPGEMAAVEGWFLRNLGAAYRRYEGEYAPMVVDADDFDLDTDGVIFAREADGRAVGVLIEAADGRVDLNVFEIRGR